MKHADLERGEDRWRLRYERRLAHPPQKVWRAITEPEHVKAWFPTAIVGEWAPGGRLEFPFVDQDLPTEEGVVLRCEPPSLLEFTCGGDVLLFELAPDGDGTLLRFLVTLDENGKAARDGAGWHECLDLLATVLDGGRPWPPGQRWGELAPVYVEAFGPEASTIGPPDGWQVPAGER